MIDHSIPPQDEGLPVSKQKTRLPAQMPMSEGKVVGDD
jgi:hypothetical protein